MTYEIYVRLCTLLVIGCNGTCLKCMFIHSPVKKNSNSLLQDNYNFLFAIEENICTVMHGGHGVLINSA